MLLPERGAPRMLRKSRRLQLCWSRILSAGALCILASSSEAAAPERMVLIPGGDFQMGTENGFTFEKPVHMVKVRPFYMDSHEVTVADFRRFVEQTRYVTEMEKQGQSQAFDFNRGQWMDVSRASWRFPQGKGNAAAKPKQPVTQVSWNDAVAYAKWEGKRLPTEAEFEFAARGGLKDAEYSWGNELRPNGKCVANWWQGTFPAQNNLEDGFAGPAPVGSFPPNGYGLYDITGNAWEWCADWFDKTYYSRSPKVDPQGPESGDVRVIRGGSFMCSENYCTGFRVAARNRKPPTQGSNNVGFRCVLDVDDANVSSSRTSDNRP